MPQSSDKSLALKELAELLDQAELRYIHVPDSPVLGVNYASDFYLDEQGDKRIAVSLSVEPDEHLVIAEIPSAYRLEHARDKRAARKALLYVNYSLKATHFGIDPRDANEVVARAEIWLTGVIPSGRYIGAALTRFAGQFDLAARLLQPVWRGGKRELQSLLEREMRPPEHPPRQRSRGSGSGGASRAVS